MPDFFASPYFGLGLTLAAYIFGVFINKKTKVAIASPIAIALAIIITVLVVFDIKYEDYYEGGQFINMMLVPATACLAIPIFNKLALLKKNIIPIVVGCGVGAIVCIFTVTWLCSLFGLSEELTLSMVPKSITTPFGISLSETIGGEPSITVICILITGITGAMTAPYLAKLFRIDDPLTQGIATGTASHVLGTSKAITMGETQGAMSGLAVPITGVITVIFSLIYF